MIYLQMDGVDDYLKTSTLTFDEVVIDFSYEYKNAVWEYFIDTTSGTRRYVAINTDALTGGEGSWSAIYADGNSISKASQIPKNQRTTLRLLLSAAEEHIAFFFSSFAPAGFMKGNIYDIKFYNVGVLVAHYDMSTGTVNDQSGNGNHATLNGGTWVQDTSTPITSTSSFVGESTLTATPRVIRSSTNLRTDATSILNLSAVRIVSQPFFAAGISELTPSSRRICESTTLVEAIAGIVAVGEKIAIGQNLLHLIGSSMLEVFPTKIASRGISLTANSDIKQISFRIKSVDTSFEVASDLAGKVNRLRKNFLSIEGETNSLFGVTRIRNRISSLFGLGSYSPLGNRIAASQIFLTSEGNIVAKLKGIGEEIYILIFLKGEIDDQISLQAAIDSLVKVGGEV